jgi:hypothetical protein
LTAVAGFSEDEGLWRTTDPTAPPSNVAQEATETLHGLVKRYDLLRNLIRLWAQNNDAGRSNDDATAADLSRTRGADRHPALSGTSAFS